MDLLSGAETSGRAASAALPPKDHVRPLRPRRDNRLACDVCGHARTRDERHRLVWEADHGTRLVLAELCRGCAAGPEPLIERYGGSGREAIRVVQEIRAAPPPRTVQIRVLGLTTRTLLYVLIAAASFLVVTLATSH